RHHRCAVYSVTLGPVREDMYATESIRAPRGQELSAVYGLSTRLKNEQDLVIVFGDSIRGNLVRELVSWGDSLGIPVKYVCLVDDCNSRGAVDMGVLPTPGGWTIREILASPELDSLWIIGANTLKQEPLAAGHAFVVVQDLFLTKTASHADVVLPASSAYEKGGTMTNVCGEVQRLERAVQVEGTKPDLNIFQMIATAMKVPLRAANYAAVWDDISKSVPGYQIPRSKLTAENACSTTPGVPDDCAWDSSSVRSREDTIFTSGTLGRYCATLGAVLESPSGLYRWPHY
ncbi:MAG TPA: molybdopterin-dependent oxidoreductase, partial [Nitrospira sp.]|nr:molybdopterin-dependent oxidoreductase [Nitrospira sp.]